MFDAKYNPLVCFKFLFPLYDIKINRQKKHRQFIIRSLILFS